MFSGKKLIDLKEKTKANSRQKKKNKKTPALELNGASITRQRASTGQQPPSGDEEEEEEGVSSTSSFLPATGNSSKQKNLELNDF